MDNDKLYELQNDGTYCIHFPNKQGWPNPKIKEIFSEFGNVVSVKCAGDQFGFRFVRYQTEEEACCCIEGVKANPAIRLLPFLKQKKKEKEYNYRDAKKVMNHQTNGFLNEMQDSSSRQSIKSNDSNSKDSWNFGNNQSQSYRLQEPFGASNRKAYDNNSRVGPWNGAKKYDDEACNNSYTSDRESNSSRFMNNKGHWQSNNVDRRQPQENVDKDMSKLMKLHNLRGVNANTFKVKAQSQEQAVGIDLNEQPINDTVSSALPVRGNPEDSNDEIPPLVQNLSNLGVPSPSNSLTQRRKIVKVEEVIVANVHPLISIHYILHLFHKYDPICVSDMKTIPKIDVRYCHVYVKTPQDALEIERKYDKFEVEGINLIVLRPSSLEKQAYSI